jgi:hypothetical protein
MRALVAALVALTGVGLMVAGVWMVFPPAALVLAGGALAYAGLFKVNVG